LIELDGAKTNSNERVLIIGATNLPKELDDAVRRRFVKRLYIPLPNTDGRIQLIKSLTNNTAFRLE
jgi:SpoVK/Ycf46/Vps4 family AAA+-type ATPase